MFYRLLFYFFLGVFFLGCGTGNSTNPKKSTDTTIYKNTNITTVSTKKDSSSKIILKKGWPSHFFVSMKYKYKIMDSITTDLNSYSSGYKVSSKGWQEAIVKSNTNKNHIIVIIFNRYKTIFGTPKNYKTAMKNKKKLLLYFKTFKQTLKKLSNAKGNIVLNLEPEFMPYLMGDVLKHHKGDITNIKLDLSKLQDSKLVSITPPNNLSGFWQILEALRDKYAPNVMLAPTVKNYNLGTNPANEPDGGWDVSSKKVQKLANYFNSFNLNWDALAFSFKDKQQKSKNKNKKHKNKSSTIKIDKEEKFKRYARFISAVSKLVKNEKTNKRVRPYIWKASINAQHFDKFQNWKDKTLYYEFKNIDYLAQLGFSGINLIAEKNATKDKTKIPDIINCWLEEYFNAEDKECEVDATIGLVDTYE
jgi:hypothetical protein